MDRDVVIEPRRLKGEPCLPESGVLAVNPTDVKWLEEIAASSALQRHHLFHSRLYSSPHSFLAGPAVGAPMATLCLEKLIALGARKIVLFGWCGSLDPKLAVGDLLAPSSGISEEGTSKHYSDSKTFCPDLTLRRELVSCLEGESLVCADGTVWSTDAPYRETRAKVSRYASRGVLGVEMEFTALCALASFRRVEFAAALLVSDELWRNPWTPSYGDKKFKKRSRNVINVLHQWLEEPY